MILGDSGYPLLNWLLVPIVEYPVMTVAEKRYNKAHTRARSVIERIIGILKRRWACLNELRMMPGKCCEINLVCCILHNLDYQSMAKRWGRWTAMVVTALMKRGN